MKKNIIFIFIVIIITIPTIIACNNLLLRNQLKEINNNNNTCNPNKQEEVIKPSVSVNIYDCKFTTTYRVVNLLDNYIAEVPEYSYIVVDKFQDHQAIAHKIPTKLKNNLELNKYYEFTYYIKGTGNIENIYDVINHIYINHTNNDNLSVTLEIKETVKTGLEQIQENICSH